MSALERTLGIRSAPHIASGHSVDRIMFNVVLALLPVSIFAVVAFGLVAALVLVTAVLVCVATEHALCRWTGRASTVADGSVTVTGLLYGLTLPPGLPLWMVAVGAVVSVVVGKALFGGLGANPFNPALVGRAFLQAAFPVPMTSWVAAFGAERFAGLPSSTLALPFSRPLYDAVSGATPLTRWKFEGELTEGGALFLGSVDGSLGEISTLLVGIGGIYLIARRMMNWRIPVAVFASVGLLSAALHLLDPTRHAPALFMLTSGGLALGAVFMASDMVGSPMSSPGMWIYGAVIGAIVVAIRTWAGMPEGVMYAVLLGNALAPHLDQRLRPRVYGSPRWGRSR